MNAILKGGLVLGICALISKIIGAMYRIPLTILLGSEGIGIYQTVFPFYLILLTLSSTGIPNALSKLIAEGKNPKKVVYKSIIAFGSIGLVGTFLMILLAERISILQGNPSAKISYIAIAPSVFLVSVLSALRGYYQGLSNMKPTGISQVVEQVVKLIFGLLTVRLFGKTPAGGAFFAALSVTVSEIIAVIFVIFYGRIKRQKPIEKEYLPVKIKDIFKVVLPVTLTSIMLPLCRTADSFLVVNLIKRYSENAVSLYGIYTGAIESIVGVPVALCYGIAVSGLPIVSGSKQGKSHKKILLYTAILSVIAGILTFLFSDLAINVMYFNMAEAEKLTAQNLLKISALSVVLLPIVQATSLVLIGKDKLYRPAFSLFFGLIVKIILTLWLVNIPAVNIYGTAFSDIACYFVAGFLNLLYIIKEERSEVIRPVITNMVGRQT